MFKGFLYNKTFVHWSVYVGTFSILDAISLWSFACTLIIQALQCNCEPSPQSFTQVGKVMKYLKLENLYIYNYLLTENQWHLESKIFEYKTQTIFFLMLLGLFSDILVIKNSVAMSVQFLYPLLQLPFSSLRDHELY